MSFSSNKILIAALTVLIGTRLMAVENSNTIPDDINYTYNAVDIKLAKTSHSSWKKGKEYGYFTAIVYRDGFEHGFEVVRVLISKAKTFNNGTSDLVTVKDIQIDTPGITGYVEDMDLEVINNKLSLGIDIRTRQNPHFIVKQNIMVDLNGTVTNIIPFRPPFEHIEAFYTK